MERRHLLDHRDRLSRERPSPIVDKPELVPEEPTSSDIRDASACKEELDTLANTLLGEGDLFYFKPKCHPAATLTACYDRTNGTMCVSCVVCNRALISVKVASRDVLSEEEESDE